MGLGLRLTGYQNHDSKPSKPSDYTGGTIYSFAGYDWSCAEIQTNYIVLQMATRPSVIGTWPGYRMTGPSSGSGSWGPADTAYDGDIDGEDIHTYSYSSFNFTTLWSTINGVEYKPALYGSGLYLISTSKYSASGVHYKEGFTHGLSSPYAAWLGTFTYGQSQYDHDAYIVSYVGSISTSGGQYKYSNMTVMPAFNLDCSKVKLDGTQISLLA